MNTNQSSPRPDIHRDTPLHFVERGIKGVRWFLVFGFFVAAVFAATLFQSANPFDSKSYRVIIPKGISTSAIQAVLEEKKILKPKSSFAFAAKILGFSKQIQAGEYSFSPSQTTFGVLLKLRKGEVLPAKQIGATFPEGTSIYKMGKILEKAGFANFEKFQDLADEGVTQPVREKYREIFKYISSESLEGYLYPDTYYVFSNAKVEDLAEKMLSRFKGVVMPFWKKASRDTKYNLHEILTLASIIEKEAKTPSERPIISSLYYNRLRAGMPLAADPTIKYALEKPTKKVYLNQLSINSPYNTYKRKGLPPGPICNPGIESIKAAVYPAKTNHYYFVARKDGSHIFSSTWEEHQRARQKVSIPTR